MLWYNVSELNFLARVMFSFFANFFESLATAVTS